MEELPIHNGEIMGRGGGSLLDSYMYSTLRKIQQFSYMYYVQYSDNGVSGGGGGGRGGVWD